MDYPRNNQERYRDRTVHVQDADAVIPPPMREVRMRPFRERSHIRIQDTSGSRQEDVDNERSRTERGNRFYRPIPSPEDLNDQVGHEHPTSQRRFGLGLDAASRTNDTGRQTQARDNYRRGSTATAASGYERETAVGSFDDIQRHQLTPRDNSCRRSDPSRIRLSSIFCDPDENVDTLRQRRENQQPVQSPVSSADTSRQRRENQQPLQSPVSSADTSRQRRENQQPLQSPVSNADTSRQRRENQQPVQSPVSSADTSRQRRENQQPGQSPFSSADTPRQRRENQQPGQSPFSSAGLSLSGNNNSADLYDSNQNWMEVFAAHNQRQGRIPSQERDRMNVNRNPSEKRGSSTEALFANFDRLRQERHQQKKKIEFPKMKAPKKQPRFSPYVKVVVKKGKMNFETKQVTLNREAGDPLEVDKDWSLDVLDQKLKRMFKGQNLFFEHIDGDDVLITDSWIISDKITMLRSRNEEVEITVGEVKSSGMFKCPQVGNANGTHLLVKAAPFPEEKNIKEDSESFTESFESIYYDDPDWLPDPEEKRLLDDSDFYFKEQNGTTMENSNYGYKSDPDSLPDPEERGFLKGKRGSDVDEGESEKDIDSHSDPEDNNEKSNAATQDVEVKLEREVKLEPEEPEREEFVKLEPEDKFNPQINGIVAQDGHLCSLSPHLIDGVLSKQNIAAGEKVLVDRQNPLESFNEAYLKLKKEDSLEGNIYFSFLGEMAMDFGGVTREALTLLIWAAKKSNLLSGDESRGFTFVPNFGLADYFEMIGYFLFKASTLSSVYPLLPNLAISMITEKNSPQNDHQWMHAFRQYPTINGSELLYNLVAMDQYGLETLEEKEVNIYLSLQNISKLVMKDEDFRPGQEKEIMGKIFKYEITASQLWMWAAIRKGYEKTGFTQLQKEHPSLLSVYSVEMSAFGILTAEDFNSKFQYEVSTTEDHEAVEESKRQLWGCLQALEGGVSFKMGDDMQILKLHDLCVYLTGSPNLLCVQNVGVSFSRDDYQYFQASTCSRTLIIPLGLEATVFECSLFEKLSFGGGFSMA